MRGLRVVFLAVIAAFAAAGPLRAKDSPPDPDLGTSIVGVAAFDGQLWVQGAAGALVSFALSDGTRTLRIARGVVGLQKRAGHLFVLAPAAEPQAFDLLEWKNGALLPQAHFMLAKDARLLTLASVGDQAAIVASDGIHLLDDAGWHAIAAPLGGHHPFGDSPAATGASASANALYLGYNFGEWGGGFKRIDLKTGAMTPPDAPSPPGSMSGGLFGGGSVNAIIADPAHDDCVLAAMGLVHFFASGSIDRVCSETITTVFENPPAEADGKFHSNEAFFGLIPAKNGYWAVSTGAVYHFGASGAPQRYPIGKLNFWHGLFISRGAPGAIVVYTELNRRFSVNSGTPLVAPLD